MRSVEQGPAAYLDTRQTDDLYVGGGGAVSATRSVAQGARELSGCDSVLARIAQLHNALSLLNGEYGDPEFSAPPAFYDDFRRDTEDQANRSANGPEDSMRTSLSDATWLTYTCARAVMEYRQYVDEQADYWAGQFGVNLNVEPDSLADNLAFRIGFESSDSHPNAEIIAAQLMAQVYNGEVVDSVKLVPLSLYPGREGSERVFVPADCSPEVVAGYVDKFKTLLASDVAQKHPYVWAYWKGRMTAGPEGPALSVGTILESMHKAYETAEANHMIAHSDSAEVTAAEPAPIEEPVQPSVVRDSEAITEVLPLSGPRILTNLPAFHENLERGNLITVRWSPARTSATSYDVPAIEIAQEANSAVETANVPEQEPEDMKRALLATFIPEKNITNSAGEKVTIAKLDGDELQGCLDHHWEDIIAPFRNLLVALQVNPQYEGTNACEHRLCDLLRGKPEMIDGMISNLNAAISRKQ